MNKEIKFALWVSKNMIGDKEAWLFRADELVIKYSPRLFWLDRDDDMKEFYNMFLTETANEDD